MASDGAASRRRSHLPRRVDLDAVVLRPADVPLGQRAERVEGGRRAELVDLVEERREDAPRLDELGRRDEERLVAARRVEEHALVRVADVRALELRGVRHVHHDGAAVLLGGDPRLLRLRDHVDRLVGLQRGRMRGQKRGEWCVDGG